MLTAQTRRTRRRPSRLIPGARPAMIVPPDRRAGARGDADRAGGRRAAAAGRGARDGADVVAAEDTRRLRRLTADLGVDRRRPGRVLLRGQRVGADAGAARGAAWPGERVLLVTDAGMPSVSDPGYRLVVAAVEPDVHVTAVPGPVGGADRARGHRAAGRPVLLRGLPAAQGRRARRAGSPTLAAEQRTMVFFEAPHRTEAALAAMAEAFGDDRAGGGLPRADQDLRGGTPRAARRPRRVGRRGRARRGDDRGRRRRAVRGVGDATREPAGRGRRRSSRRRA